MLVNSIDPAETPQNVAFHQGLHCLLRLKQYSRAEERPGLEILLYIHLEHPLPTRMDESISENQGLMQLCVLFSVL